MGMTMEEANKVITQGPETIIQDSNVAPSDNLQKAARDEVEAKKDLLVANMQSAVVTKLILSGRPLVDRVVAGEKAKGRIKPEHIDRIYQSIVEKSGYDAATDTFKYVPATNVEDARAVLNAVLAAKEDPEMEFEINFTKSSAAVKGVYLDKADGVPVIMKKDTLRDFLCTETIGVVKTAVSGASIGLVAASKFDKDKKKPSDKMIDVSQVTDPGKIMLLRFIKKSLILDAGDEYIEYYKELQTDKEYQTGARSKLSFKYNKKVSDTETKTMTYRIPLIAEMFTTKVVNEEFVNIFPERDINKVFDFNDPAEVQKQLDKLVSLKALLAQSGVKGSLVDDIRTTASEIKSESDKSVEDAFNA